MRGEGYRNKWMVNCTYWREDEDWGSSGHNKDWVLNMEGSRSFLCEYLYTTESRSEGVLDITKLDIGYGRGSEFL